MSLELSTSYRPVPIIQNYLSPKSNSAEVEMLFYDKCSQSGCSDRQYWHHLEFGWNADPQAPLQTWIRNLGLGPSNPYFHELSMWLCCTLRFMLYESKSIWHATTWYFSVLQDSGKEEQKSEERSHAAILLLSPPWALTARCGLWSSEGCWTGSSGPTNSVDCGGSCPHGCCWAPGTYGYKGWTDDFDSGGWLETDCSPLSNWRKPGSHWISQNLWGPAVMPSSLGLEASAVALDAVPTYPPGDPPFQAPENPVS